MSRFWSLGSLHSNVTMAENLVAGWEPVKSKAELRAEAKAAYKNRTANAYQLMLLNPAEVQEVRRDWDGQMMAQLAMRRAGIAREIPITIGTYTPDETPPRDLATSISVTFWMANQLAPPDELGLHGMNVRDDWFASAHHAAVYGDEEAMTYRNRVWEKAGNVWQLRPSTIEASRTSPYGPAIEYHWSGNMNPRLEEVLEHEQVPEDASAYDFALAVDRYRTTHGFIGRPWNKM